MERMKGGGSGGVDGGSGWRGKQSYENCNVLSFEIQIVESEHITESRSHEMCVPGQRCCPLPVFQSQESQLESVAGCKGSGKAADQNPSGASR